MKHTPISTTSAGILGLLSLRAWSSYDLTAQVRRSLRFVLPRAESALYAEQRRLAERDLVSVETEAQGRRSRKVYRLAPEGRRALARWLAGPATDPQVEVEVLLRVLFADLGTRDDLMSALGSLEDWATRELGDGRAICAAYLAGEAPFPERLHLNALFADYYHGLYEHTLAWVARAREEVATWDDVAGVGLTPGGRAALQRIVDG